MDPVNNNQVQSTNDASTTSKCSAAAKNYFTDKFIEHFVDKKKPRASLINLGYYTRSVILFRLVESYIKFLMTKNFIKFQIVSCGAGFDTSYWRLSDINLLPQGSVFIEIDFPSVVRRKMSIITHSKALRSFTQDWSNRKTHPGVHKMNDNYYLLEADLSHLETLESLFNSINIDFDIPTLFLSECVITYMKKDSSNNLIEWMARKFKNGAFVNYEQIHPDDGFGKVMLSHFQHLQTTLHSVIDYPDCVSHCNRYRNLGFERVTAASEWEGFRALTTPEERQRAFRLELFDEFEEFHSKCVHYVIAVAGRGAAVDWVDSLPFTSTQSYICKRNIVSIEKVLSNQVEIYRHCSVAVNRRCVYLIGGCSKQGRSHKVHRLNFHEGAGADSVDVIGNVRMDVLYASAEGFELNDSHYCCLYGGRTSPDSVCNEGTFLLYEILNDKWLLKHVIREGNPRSRYRAAIASLVEDGSIVNIWLFGGRSPTLGESMPELSVLRVTSDREGCWKHSWRSFERREREEWPSSRMSHGMVACSRTASLLVSCGLRTDSFEVLNDIWNWNWKTECWSQMELNGEILPRYGHTCHLIDEKLYLVGGVNTMAGSQPGLAIVNLRNLNVAEFSLEVTGPEPVLLFNHASEIVDFGGKPRLLIFGGGGNCFSFGTHLNQGTYSLSIDEKR